jgi:hypothetical protein
LLSLSMFAPFVFCFFTRPKHDNASARIDQIGSI